MNSCFILFWSHFNFFPWKTNLGIKCSHSIFSICLVVCHDVLTPNKETRSWRERRSSSSLTIEEETMPVLSLRRTLRPVSRILVVGDDDNDIELKIELFNTRKINVKQFTFEPHLQIPLIPDVWHVILKHFQLLKSCETFWNLQFEIVFVWT